MISARMKALIGATSLGFSTTVHPAASAGATLRTIWYRGKFHGVMAPTTPTGSLMTSELPISSCQTYDAARAGVVGELPRGQPHLERLGEAPRHPHLVADHVGDLCGAGLEPLRHLLKERPPVLGRRGRPGGEGTTCRLDRPIDVSRGPGRDGGEHLLGGRVDDVQRLGSRRRDPGSVDVKGVSNDHGRPSSSTTAGAAH